MVYVEVIFTAFCFLIFIAWNFNTGEGLRKKMTVINGMFPQEIKSGPKLIPLTWNIYSYVMHLEILVEQNTILNLYED